MQKNMCKDCAFTTEYVKRLFCANEDSYRFTEDVTDITTYCTRFFPKEMVEEKEYTDNPSCLCTPEFLTPDFREPAAGNADIEKFIAEVRRYQD